MEEGRLRSFLADFDYQVSEIQRVYETLSGKAERLETGATSELAESVGYWIHNLYSAYEDLFKLVAAFWENDVPSGGTYHVSLLRRMRTAIEGIRPALLSAESYQYLDELRGFRHVFRHAYSYGLDEHRVTLLVQKTFQAESTISEDLQRFRKAIEALIDQGNAT